MSVLPIFSSFLLGSVLVSVFLWNMILFKFVLVCLIILLLIYLWDSSYVYSHFESAFWLFIISEVIVFGSLLFSCLYFDHWSYVNLSSPLELPFIGCFLLLGSSVTVTGFHHLFGWQLSSVLLLFTIVLGGLFVCLQFVEMEEVMVNIFDSSFHASSFCTVGLHFSHVLLGLIGLSTILLVGYSKFGYYRCTLLTWYWHFVDYVWLFVYTLVYVC
uniref:Cytochrome c oxidase subunit 3 n=1 Tax=Cloacotaenia megalops TaxID=576527 RepID=A0A1L2FZE2_9CEST|nr:cytochrome c oxidase subunit III [Cloacotaenia megalops]AOG66045.1 cytochrome c oxidase subunit III [Cloacotaenia megalops]